MKYIVLLALVPVGLAVSLYSAARGWPNGRHWWELWRDIWFDRPSRVGVDKRGGYRVS